MTITTTPTEQLVCPTCGTPARPGRPPWDAVDLSAAYHCTCGAEFDHPTDPRIHSREHLHRDDTLVTGPRQAHLTATRPEEAFCHECERRVTLGPDGTEYGHRAGQTACSLRDDPEIPTPETEVSPK